MIIGLWPAVARADAPVAVDQSVPVSNPTTVALEATVTGTTEMTFSIASSPARGLLGQISTPTCQPTGTGSTECKATLTYTPNVCTSGPDSFTYTATDMATAATSNPATITLIQGPPPASSPSAPSLAPNAAVSAGVPFTATAGTAIVGATADYGDGSGTQPLSVDPAGNAALTHTYAAEGTYALTVTNPGACDTSAAASERVDVVGSGALDLTSANAPPGGNASIALPGVIGLTATLVAAPTDQSAGILGATYPATSPLFAVTTPMGQLLAGYDVRAINVSSSDSAVVTFSFPDGGIPTAASVLYFDPQTKR
ncbi:MAG TPA: Ig-like domain-containing protein, partial [Solirubrobacteraceae bacterium]|nr:Ig-like domain-containing protein [Solirubrobacteraceae bacterium]